MKVDNRKLIKWVYFVPTVSIVITIVVTVYILINKEKVIYNNNLVAYRSHLVKMKEIEIKDRLDKLTEQIKIIQDTVTDDSKNSVKNMVDLAYEIIEKIYNENRSLDKKEIIQKIKDKLKNIRFFDNFSGYFFMYYLDGTCIMLPTNPELEGKNLLGVKDAKGAYIIKKAISELRNRSAVFDSWYWHKPGSKNMEKKIGYFRSFKPLNIYVGSAFYVEDAIEKTKKIALKMIRNYRYGENGYIFAYDYKGNTLSHIKKELIGKNRIKLVVNNIHVVKESIEGAKLMPDGFFYVHNSSYNPYKKIAPSKISYIKAIPEFQWFLGTGFYKHDIDKVINSQSNYFQKELKDLLKNIIIATSLLIFIILIIMIFISRKINNIIKNYKKSIELQHEEILKHKKRFELLFEKSKDAVILTDGDKIIDCNSSAGELYGIKNENEFLTLNLMDLSPKLQPNNRSSKKEIEKITRKVLKYGAYRGEWLSKRVDNGKLFWIESVTTLIEMENKKLFYIVLRDISKRKATEDKLIKNKMDLAYKARHDALTNLPNRFMFKEIIPHEISRAKRENSKLAVIFIDIDSFKEINDLYGHEVGDKFLIKVAEQMQKKIRDVDYLFRFGGDEFVILVNGLKDEKSAISVVDKLKNNLETSVSINKLSISISLSMGVALYPDDGNSKDALLRNADIAMYRAKERGKNRVEFYKKEMFEKIRRYHTIEESLLEAIAKKEFELFYQPKVDVKNKKIVGLEALIRWIKDGKIISPGAFIDVAESSNLIIDIGYIVMDKAFSFATKLKEKNILNGRISINLSDKQLKKEDLPQKLKYYLEKNNCSADLIEIEVLERFIMSDIEKSSKLLQKIKDMGFSISIDDFGTGYSSMAYIKNLPFNVLKIDKSFIDDVPGSYKDEAVVKTIIELTEGLHVSAIAEGVETEEQKNFLRENGCFLIQGYLYSKPLPESDIIDYIKNFKEFL